MIPSDWIALVNDYWFEALTPRDWFRVDATVDATVRARFGALREALVHTPPAPASLDVEGHVAAVVVFDQFPRNLFRGRAEAFATDALALAVARHAVDHGLDVVLPSTRRQVLYLPFMHAEDLATQEASVALYERLGVPDALRAAIGHRATIARFRRFPARDKALGRV